MTISNYAKSLGIKTKKEIRTFAPKGAHWSDLSGHLFYKIVGDRVFIFGTADEWIPSGMGPDMFTPMYFHKLK